MAINKVVYGNNTLMDITDTTATTDDVANGKVFYSANGTRSTGTASGGSIASYYFDINRFIRAFNSQTSRTLNINLTQEEITALNEIKTAYNDDCFVYFFYNSTNYRANVTKILEAGTDIFNLSYQMMFGDENNGYRYLKVEIECYSNTWGVWVGQVDTQYENTDYKSRVINEYSTYDDYPSAKAVYDLVSQSTGEFQKFYIDGLLASYFETYPEDIVNEPLSEDDVVALMEILEEYITSEGKSTIKLVSDDTLYDIQYASRNWDNDLVGITAIFSPSSNLIVRLTLRIIPGQPLTGTYSIQNIFNLITNANAVSSSTVRNIVTLTQAQYNALSTKDNETLYIIVG